MYEFGTDFLFFGSSTYTTSGDGNVGATTTVDASLTQADDYWNGCYIKYLTAENLPNIGAVREITDFDDGTNTLTHDAFPAQTKNGDTYLLSAWKIVEDGQTLSTPTSTNNDYLTLTASASGGNTDGYLTNFTNLGLSTTLYPYCRYRAKSNDGTAKYEIVAEYDDASTSTVLAEGTSTTWTEGTTALTATKTLDHLRFACNTSDDTVYYDFALVYTGDFTFPSNQPETMTFTPSARHVYLQSPSRIGDITQHIGSDSATVEMVCNVDIGDWKRGSDYVNGEVFLDISHNSKDEPWQWLDTEYEQFKVTMNPPRFVRTGESHLVYLTFREYRYGTADDETEVERYGLNL